MITNGNDIIEYKDYDKVYIPTNKKIVTILIYYLETI